MLDRWLGGGLRSGLLTELVGEAGAAKSQLAFQLLLQVQLPLPPPSLPASSSSASYGLDGCGLYLSTEGGGLPVSRLEQLASGLRRRRPGLQLKELLQRLLVMECRSIDELLDAVKRVEDGSSGAQQRRQGGRIRLIVIDSIAALFRLDEAQPATDGGGSSSASSASLSSSRSSQLFRLSASLRRLSRLQGVVVVVCNQVSDRMDDGDAAGGAGKSGAAAAAAAAGSSLDSSGRSVVPALGLSWSSCINARIGLTRQGGGRGAVTTDSGVQRHMQLVFAPHLPCSRIQFHLDADGVRGEPGSVEDMAGQTTEAVGSDDISSRVALTDISNSSRLQPAAAAPAPYCYSAWSMAARGSTIQTDG